MRHHWIKIGAGVAAAVVFVVILSVILGIVIIRIITRSKRVAIQIGTYSVLWIHYRKERSVKAFT